MISRLPTGLMDMVVLDHMPTPGPITNTNASAWHVIYFIVRGGDTFGSGDIYPGDLLAKYAAVMDQVVFSAAFECETSLRPAGQLLRTDETDGAIASFYKLATRHRISTVVKIHKDSISTNRVKKAVGDMAVARPFHKYRSSPVN